MNGQAERDTQQNNAPAWRLPLILLVVSAALSAPAVFSGWMNDDYFFDTALYETDTPFGYYNFIEHFRESHLLPWWVDPDFKLRFFRPLTSLTLHLDFTLWGTSPLGAHLQSLMWSLLQILGGFLLLGRVLPRREARLAMIVFTLSICHAWGAGWIAARNAVVGGAMAVWSAYFYIRRRQSGEGRSGIAAYGLFTLGLLGGEVALAMPGFALGYEIAGARDSFRKRVNALLPLAVLVLIYIAAYKILGFGARGSGAYLDPLTYPGDYLIGAVPKILAVLGAFGFGTPAILRAIPGADIVPIIAGGLVLILFGLGLWLVRYQITPEVRRSLGWLALVVFLPMLPALSGIAQGREFVLSCIAFSAVSVLLLRALMALRGRWYHRILTWGVAGLLFLGLFGINAVSRFGQSLFILKSVEMTEDAGKGSVIQCDEKSPVYVINGDFMRSVGFPLIVSHYRGITFPGWQHLITPVSDIRVERTALNRIVVTSEKEPLINDFLQLYRRDDARFRVGETVKTEYVEVEVLSVSDDGPTQLAFTIPGLVAPPGACMLRYEDGVLRNWNVPQVGETETIPFVPPF